MLYIETLNRGDHEFGAHTLKLQTGANGVVLIPVSTEAVSTLIHRTLEVALSPGDYKGLYRVCMSDCFYYRVGARSRQR